MKVPEPCPDLSCRYHVLSDARECQLSTVGEPIVTCSLKLAGVGGMTLEAIGAVMGVTRERVRQIEKSAIRNLNRSLARLGHCKETLVHSPSRGG